MRVQQISVAAKERRFALVLFLPAFVLLLVTTTLPLVYLIWSSFQRINLSTPWLRGFVGLANYVQLAGDERFWDLLLLTVIYTTTTVVLQIALGLGLALLVIQVRTGQALVRIAAILPIVIAPVVAGLFWRSLILAPNFGVINFVTQALGLGSYDWLGEPRLAVVSVIMIHTWQWTPFAFLVLLANIVALPADIFEAAKLDRAGPWQRFRYITLPLIRPAIVIVVILRMVTALSAFAAIFAATGGGPGTATEILNLYIYRVSFSDLNIGYGSAAATVLMLITFIVAFFLFSLRRTR